MTYSKSVVSVLGANMQVEQYFWQAHLGWKRQTPLKLEREADLVLIFGQRDMLAREDLRMSIVKRYPHALLAGCSTAGEINGTSIHDDSLVLTALSFATTRVRLALAPLHASSASLAAGKELASQLLADDLSYVLLLSDGMNSNGSELIRGLYQQLPDKVKVSGGLAGDGTRFGQTLLLANGQVMSDSVLAIGFYGADLQTGHGSVGGWEPFGPIRQITRAEGNVLYELDGQSALALYKRYLGPQANRLPSAALRFPLSLRHSDEPDEVGLTRTILSLDEDSQAMTFAGDMPEGRFVRLMKFNADQLVEGAARAAEASLLPQQVYTLLVSCVGRRMVLGQRSEEELEAVRGIVGPLPVLSGFYSYGEISPHICSGRCELHNQSMTVTTFWELPAR